MSLGKGPRKNGLRKMVPEKWSSGKKIRGEMVLWKRYPEKWSSGKKYAEKWSLGKRLRKNGPLEKNPRRNGPRKSILKKLFSVKRMLGNLDDF